MSIFLQTKTLQVPNVGFVARGFKFVRVLQFGKIQTLTLLDKLICWFAEGWYDSEAALVPI